MLNKLETEQSIDQTQLSVIDNCEKSSLTISQQKKILIINRLLSLINSITFAILLLLVCLYSYAFRNPKVYPEETGKKIWEILVIFCSLELCLNLFYLFNSFYSNYTNYWNYRTQFLLLSFLSFNLWSLCLNITLHFVENHNTKRGRTVWKAMGFYRWQTYDLVLIGLFVALTLIMTVVEENFLPKLPNGGGVGLKYLILMLASVTLSFLGGLTTGIISALLMLLFGSGFIISPWSFILDYLLPMMTPAIVGLFSFNRNHEKNVLEYTNYVIAIILTFVLIWLWQTMAGCFVWKAIGWGFQNSWNYSLIYNAWHIWIFTYPITQIIAPPLLRVAILLKKNC